EVAGSCIEASAAFEVRPRRIGLKPKNKRVELIVEPYLAPRERAMGVDCSMGRVEDFDWPTSRIVCEVAAPAPPRIAGMNADVETGPADGLYGLDGRRECL